METMELMPQMDAQSRIKELERENRKLRRDKSHLMENITMEKLAYTTIMNNWKVTTFLQHERERYLTLLLANSPSIILFLNKTGRVEFCTDYFVKKTGFKSVKDMEGHTLSEALAGLMDEAAHQNLMALCDQVQRSGKPETFEIAFRFKEHSEEAEFAGLLVSMHNEQQENGGLMLMLHDVTDLKRTREEALAASKAKSDFLSNMSHEIRTPMNAIIGMTAIGKNDKDPVRKNYAFEQIESASVHLLGIINDILDISKIESGKMELSPISFSLRQMLERIMSVITQRIQEKQQHFSLEIAKDMPDFLFGDDQRLAQIITNILSNAVKFTPDKGDISMRIGIKEYRNEAYLIKIEIQDSGIGISERERARLFQIFQQAQAGTARKYGGSGLGLAISKRLIEMMGGEIWVESEVGRGSCFSFTLKLKEGVRPDVYGSDANAAFEAAEFSGKSILAVDDVDINLEIIAALLEPSHVTLDLVASGQEAIEAFASRPGRYDLILMDMQMPDIDGLEATRRIRALGVPGAMTIPIIAMTANVFKEDIQKCLEAGMNGHLGKPIDMQEVMAVLENYLRGSEKAASSRISSILRSY